MRNRNIAKKPAIKSMGFTLLILMLLITLTACTTKMKEAEYLKTEREMTKKGIMVCQTHNMDFLTATMRDFETWETHCYTHSPLRFYKYPIP